MRLFIGVELNDSVRAVVAADVERLGKKLARRGVRLSARWIPPENLHVTLWFLGEVDDIRCARVAAALEAPFETPAFDLRISGAGVFPASGAPRVFWMGVAEGGASLAALHAEIGARLQPLGFEDEKRRYSPHLTIARVKDPPRFDRSPRRAGMSAASVVRNVLRTSVGDVGSCGVASVTLFRSRTSPKGAAYEALLRVPLLQ